MTKVKLTLTVDDQLIAKAAAAGLNPFLSGISIL